MCTIRSWLWKEGLEFQAAADAGAVDRGGDAGDRRELNMFVFGAEKNIRAQRDVDAAADREAIEQHAVLGVAVAERVIDAGRGDEGVAGDDRRRRRERILLAGRQRRDRVIAPAERKAGEAIGQEIV